MVEAIRLRRYVPAQQRVMRSRRMTATQDFLTHYPQPPQARARAPAQIFLDRGSRTRVLRQP